MKVRIVLIVVAVLAGIMAAAGVYQYAGAVRTKVEEDTAKMKVVVAAENLPKDSLLSDLAEKELVIEQEVPKKFVSSDAISRIDGLSDRILATNVSKGQQLTQGMLATTQQAGVAFEIQEGLRAIAIDVDEVVAVSRKIRTGDQIDIIASFQGEETVENTDIAKTILQNVLVLRGFAAEDQAAERTGGVLTSADNQGDAATTQNTIVLALSLPDAEKLVFAKENGKVWLVLRPTKDASLIPTTGHTKETVLK